jgi:hypothetical protein
MAHIKYLSLTAILFCTCVSINNDKYADISGKYVASYVGKRYIFKPDRTFDTIPLTQDSLINCRFYSYDLISGSDTFDFPYDLDTLTIINEHSGRYLTRACSLHVFYNKIALTSPDCHWAL